jgi:TRAP-type C4-dicarboxylate transport system substrate-binding protein
MVDTVYAPPLGALALQWNAHVRYMHPLPLAHSTGAILMSKKYFDNIPKYLRNILKQEIELSIGGLISELRAKSEESVQLMVKQDGIAVMPLPEQEDLDAFHAVHQEAARKLSRKLYPAELLQEIYSILEDMR